MKIAVIGGGISGLTAAYYLGKQHQVSLFEAGNYLGGHTDTHELTVAGKVYPIDTGFIVFNKQNYPNFSRLLDELEVKSQPTTMSFSVTNVLSGLEYNATDINRLFCQRRNLINPKFYRMIWDLVRFYREAPKLLKTDDDSLTLGDYLESNKYSQVFINDHLLPMACALWSGPSISIKAFPARYFVQFMHNHNMLNLTARPEWRVISHGSKRYVEKLVNKSNAEFHTSAVVQSVSRNTNGVTLRVNGETTRFDKVIIATHSDQALRLLDKPSKSEIEILGGIGYQQNEMLLHSDKQILPSNHNAWASWNVRVSPDLATQCTVSYHMNTLQDIDAPLEFIVSLNSKHLINPAKVFLSRRYSHPMYNASTLSAQKRWTEITGLQHTYYCGAYWGWGFHEDGVNSALRVIEALGETAEVVTDAA